MSSRIHEAQAFVEIGFGDLSQNPLLVCPLTVIRNHERERDRQRDRDRQRERQRPNSNC